MYLAKHMETFMSIRLYNKKTGHTAACERADWTTCRDHNTSKGWTVFTPEHLQTPERKAYMAVIDGTIDGTLSETIITVESYNESIDDVYESPNDDMRAFSEDYSTRAEALRDKVTRNIREMGIGSNFNVEKPELSNPNEDVWSGTCELCGNPVTNYGSRGWEHTISYNDGTVENKLHCPF